jgi:hypothetical protein
VTLLAPFPAIAAATLAVPLLVFYYLLKLRRRPVRVSSTLLWEQATRDLEVNTPLRLIRPTWLFLIQLLALALLLLALGRPAIRAGDGTPSRVILLVDRSASMNAVDGDAAGRTRLDVARERALRAIDEVSRSGGGRASALSVVAFASDAAALTRFSADRSAAREAIAAIEPSDQPGNLEAALRLCSAMLAQDGEESSPRQRSLVVLFSDGGFDPARGYSLSGGDLRYERIGPAPAEGAAGAEPARAGERDGERGHDNLGIVAFSARRDWDDPGTVRLFARIQNASAGPIATPVVLLLNGREVERTALVIPGRQAGTASTSPGAAPPGEVSVSFRLEARDAGIASVRIDRRDLLASDDEAGIALMPAVKPRVLLVAPDAPQPGSADWMLRGVLEEMHVPVRSVPASALESDLAAGADLRADLIILDRVRPSILPAVSTLSFGAGLPAPGLDAGPARDRGTYVLTWQRSHPMLRSISLDGVYVRRPLRVRVSGEGGEARSAWSVLARGNEDPLIVEQVDRGIRRIVVGFDLAESNWPVHFGFPVFLATAVEMLSLRSEDRAGLAFLTSQPVRIPLEAGAAPGLRAEITGPRRLTARVPERAGRELDIGVLERAGVYRISGLGTDAPGAIAVNLLDPDESLLRTAAAVRVAGESVGTSGAAGIAGPREIWHWLVIAALVLLAVEWLVNGWLTRA